METLWEKLHFWKKKRQMKLNVDYKLEPSPDGTIDGIRLLSGFYKGVLYHYHKAKVHEEGDGARLEFGFSIIDNQEHDIESLTSDPDFHTIMGDILTEILTAKVNYEKTGRNDSEELDI